MFKMSIVTIKQEYRESVIKLKNCFGRPDVVNFFNKIINNMDKIIGRKFKIHNLLSGIGKAETPVYPINLEIVNAEYEIIDCNSNTFDIVTRSKPIIDEIGEIIHANLYRLKNMQSIMIPLHWFLLVHLRYNLIEEYKMLTQEIKFNKICIVEESVHIINEHIYYEPLQMFFKRQFGYGLKICDFRIPTPVRYDDMVDYLIDVYYGLININDSDDVRITENFNNIKGFNKNVMYILICVAIREAVNKLNNADKYVSFSISYDDENEILAGYNYFKNNLNKSVKEIIKDIKEIINYERENYKTEFILTDLHDTNVKYQWTNTV